MAAIGGVPEFPTSRGVPAPWAASPRAATGPRSRRVAGCPGVERPASVRAGTARGPVFRLGEARPRPIRPEIAEGEAGHREPVRRRGVRLTRRGRAVVLALLVAATAVAAILLASASRAADPAGPGATAVVRPGDTLWSVAERHAPGRDPYGTIEEIRRLNGLADYTVHPGQELELPHR
jgi:hypothetical protein